MIESEQLLTPEELFTRYYARLCEFACRVVDCEETAEDLVQDVFVSLLENNQLARVSPGSARHYLYGMVKHAALNSVRRRNIAARIFKKYTPAETEEREITHHMMQAEILGELHAALRTLPKGCADVCKLAYFEGKKNHEIAAALGVSINTIKSQKQRAINLLKRRISPQALTLLVFLLH
ncbi:RNA polymerase sigma factor [Parapedobacter sp. 2B3]|uniref:RNA polymerase sigma factor n=1 Tax=Parapedobacter sp. 2B3 TaxID=3342381 RepID=UPI0035B6A684